MQQTTETSWKEECAEVVQECLSFWPVPQAVFDGFADIVLALGFHALSQILADDTAHGLADAIAAQHLNSARSAVKR